MLIVFYQLKLIVLEIKLIIKATNTFSSNSND